jgi:Chalcone isomerase-like
MNRIFFVQLIAMATISTTIGRESHAAEIGGVKLPDQVTLEGKTLKFNGAGLRQASILKVNVYAAGLYLESPSKDAQAIADSDQLKTIELVFMRDVSANQVAGALQEAFDKNCEKDCSKLKAELVRLKAVLKEIKKGETMAYHFFPDRVEVVVGGKKNAIAGKAFPHQLIRCWIGKNPPNPGLKEGLLGMG